ncbi:hypothetical protein [Chitinasiproducens palmae]|nr:hypothetical protein [Chitinasiproducens palmae]
MLSIDVGDAAFADMNAFAELRAQFCDIAGGWTQCTEHLLALGTLLKTAHTMAREEVVARFNASSVLTEIAQPFLTRLQVAAGHTPTWPTPATALRETLADQVIMHAWDRYIRHTFIHGASDAATYARPMAALTAVAKWAGCEPVGCDLVLPDEDARGRVIFVTTLLLAIARTDSLYGPTLTRVVDGQSVRPALAPLKIASLTFSPSLAAALDDELKETALVVNPLPQLPGNDTIRFDGLCFRGAADLSFGRNGSLLLGAAPYRMPGACPPEWRRPGSIDRTHPIGTLKHSLYSVLAFVNGAPVVAPSDEDEVLHLARRLAQAIRAWEQEPVRTRVHPGWLMALHLAYSSGIEPLSMPQLRAAWRTHLFPHYRALLSRFLATPGDQSIWLREHLSTLPPLRESPTDYGLVAWIEFLRHDLPMQIDGSAGVDTAETTRLTAWRLPWPEKDMSFYRTPAEHFHIIATHFVNRMQALLVAPHLWKIDVAQLAADWGDADAYNEMTQWLGEIGLETSDEPPLALPIVHGEGDAKIASLRTAMQRFRSRLLNHPAFLANAAEVLREAQQPHTPMSVRARAHSLTHASGPRPSTIQHVFSVGGLLGLLPIVGIAARTVEDVAHGNVINSVIDGIELYLQVTDVYGAAASILFSDEVTAAFEERGAQLAEDDLRDVYLPEERRNIRMIRRGAVFREIDAMSGAVVDSGAVIAYDGQRLQRIVLRELHDAVRLPAAQRFTVRAADAFLRGLTKYADRRGQFREAFDKRFGFDEHVPDLLKDAAREAYAFFYRHSQTFRRLLTGTADDRRQWTIHVGEGLVFRTVFADGNALGQNRIELGIEADATSTTYMGVTGPQSTPYRRALLHELVHALTGLPDTAFDTILKQQRIAVRRLGSFLDSHSTPTTPDSIMSDVFKRRRRALQRILKGAKGVIDEARIGMAEQRGPVVYLVDRIGQESLAGWEERVMYLADPGGDDARLKIMQTHRLDATARMHAENDRLDRLWLDSTEITEDLPFGRGVTVSQRAVIQEWRRFADKLASRNDYPAVQSMEHYLHPSTFTVEADIEVQLRKLIQDATRRSPTFKALVGMWHVFSRGTTVWTFTQRGGATASSAPARGFIDVSEGRFIVTGLGAKPASVRRQAIAGMVVSLLDAIGFPKPVGVAGERRWLGNVLEQRVLDELGDAEPMRVNGALFTSGALSSAVDASISVLRRAALLEDRYIETLITPWANPASNKRKDSAGG